MLNREELKIEMLSKVDKKMLEEYIRKTDSGNLDGCDLTLILNLWANKKVHLYEKFGRELKISKEVECNVPESQCRKLRQDFLSEYSTIPYLVSNSFVNIIRLTEAANNYLERDYWILGTRFAKGMRVSRCFKQLLPTKKVDDYQTKFSTFVQKFKVQGKAVVSIDPIDYLTMSVNNSGWRSCHVISNGIHKAGCLSYMLDDSTAISYATDKKIVANKKVEGLSYDNKLWRQCVHIGDTFALQARQYPGINPSNRNAVADLLVEMFNRVHNTDTFAQEEKTQEEIYRYQHNNDGNAYNDIHCSSFYEGAGLISSDEESDLDCKVEINTEAICVRCGEDHNVKYSDCLVCKSCANEMGYYNKDEDDDDDWDDEEWED